jgi:hypothetical protein
MAFGEIYRRQAALLILRDMPGHEVLKGGVGGGVPGLPHILTRGCCP